jgi:galactokinase
LTDDIVEHAKSIFIYASEANDTRVKKNGDNWDERNKLQKEAIEYCRKLMMEIDLAKSLFHLRAKRVRHWYEWAKRVKSRLVAWNESDTDRYGKL